MLIAERICGNFLFIVSIAVATCLEPPYCNSPALITPSPDFTILPEIPRISRRDLGDFLEKTKFV